MEQKRKISIRKILQFLFSLVITAGCVVGIMSASKVENTQLLKGTDVRIENSDKYHFLNKEQVSDMIINNRHIDIQHIPLNKLDIQSMEHIVATNPWVSKTEVYIDNAHVLHVYVTQREPVVRIFEDSGNSYYLDTTLSEMPLSSNYVHYAQVVTNVPVLKDDSVGMDMKGQIIGLVRFIERSRFWNTQISQITMLPDHTFQLVPILGKHQILLGDTTRMAEKFDNLMMFYTKVLNRIGWDKYDVLDVRFKGQVVASPSLPWNAPVDKAMSNMSWVKSIIDNGAKDKDANPDTPGVAKPAVIKKPATVTKPVAKKSVKPAEKSKNIKKDTKQTKNTKSATKSKDKNKKSPTQHKQNNNH